VFIDRIVVRERPNHCTRGCLHRCDIPVALLALGNVDDVHVHGHDAGCLAFVEQMHKMKIDCFDHWDYHEWIRLW